LDGSRSGGHSALGVDPWSVTPVQLVEQSFIAFPRDLRGLRCRLCIVDSGVPKFILGQDRCELRSHLRSSHGVKTDITELTYFCRACDEEFSHTEEMLRHPCCAFNGQASILPQSLVPHLGAPFSGASSPFQSLGPPPRPTGNPAGASTQSNATAKVSTEDCVYCNVAVPIDSRASHRRHHERLDFQCSGCAKSFFHLSDVVKHLKEKHEFISDDEESVTGAFLEEKQLAMMPTDLRLLQCPLCSMQLLGQDRQALKEHVRRKHNMENFDKSHATFSCRACSATGFANSEEVLAHGCVGDGAGVGPRASSELSNIEFSLPEVEGDLRRMVCRICAFQANGQAFHKMIKHMEEKHRKYQNSRNVCLDSYVLFGCVNCPAFQPEGVFSWDKHFGENNLECKLEAGESSEADKEDDSCVEAANSIDNSESVAEGDLRRMTCNLCEFQANGYGFGKMIQHLEQQHSKSQSNKNVLIHEFVRFGCAYCSEFLHHDVFKWDSHFGGSSTTCEAYNFTGKEDGSVADAKGNANCDEEVAICDEDENMEMPDENSEKIIKDTIICDADD
jgi:hypothetical protein